MARSTSGLSVNSLSAQPVIPLGQTTVLTSDELDRIRKTLLHTDAKTQGQNLQSEDDRLRDKLRDMSRTRMEGWNNTLEARRRQKEAERMAKSEEYEQKRRIQDREEAEFQAAERKKCIQRATALLYENTERVKTFGSKLYLSDVMKERELQIEIKSKIKERKIAEEKLWHERTIEAVKIGDEEEEKKKKEALDRALHAKQVQLDQLEDFRVRYVSQKLEERREGELIKQRVEAHILEEKQKEQERRKLEAERAKKTMLDNQRLREEKKISDQKAQEEEERRIQYFADEKERKTRMREEREAEIMAQKQGIRQRMIDRQVAYLQSLRKNENERIAGQVREAEAKRDAELSAKNEKLRRELEEMRALNTAQLQKKAEQKRLDREQGEIDAKKFEAEYEAGLAADRAAEARRRAKRIELKNYHVKQVPGSLNCKTLTDVCVSGESKDFIPST
uniref:Trichohyalin-plectin-homology domain-containing protein n=3 Tax=Guillardia theta TaxID=55529 RepID=A0A7S4KXL4_GUITH|mmetsp:Transcript_32886/g.103990  ORF Transcript_32886/g.103990 Transcript_32886/m.103990 type:complete len:450 (+) Transcript_32886:217-1566(+)